MACQGRCLISKPVCLYLRSPATYSTFPQATLAGHLNFTLGQIADATVDVSAHSRARHLWMIYCEDSGFLNPFCPPKWTPKDSWMTHWNKQLPFSRSSPFIFSSAWANIICVHQATKAPKKCNSSNAMSPSGNCYLAISTVKLTHMQPWTNYSPPIGTH
jgi:hypothetical protein